MIKITPITRKEFDEMLSGIIGDMEPDDILKIPGVYAIASKWFDESIQIVWADYGGGMPWDAKYAINNMLEDCADMGADIDVDIRCPKCQESNIEELELELLNGEVIGCGTCGYNAVPDACICPLCGERDMDNIQPPIDDDLFHCLSCGMIYEV